MDSSWLLPSSSSKHENKENYISTATITTSTTTTLNNISLNNYGILSSLNQNSSFCLNSPSINDSFDSDKFRFDVYEKSIQKLANENKQLRKRVKNLTEIARRKEEELLNALSEDCETKLKDEVEKNIQHSAQLQSYYECFVQIEKENSSLKERLESMRKQMKSHEEKIESLTKRLGEQNTEPKLAQSHDHVDTKFENQADNEQTSELNQMSMKHIDEELTELNKTLKQFIQDKQAESDLNPSSEQKEFDVDKLNELLNYKTQRVSELELDLEALRQKSLNIEATLTRWIFRACDYNSELTKLKAKFSDYEEIRTELENNKDLLEKLVNIKKSEICIQTEICGADKSAQTHPIEVNHVGLQTERTEKSGMVAQQAAKFDQLAEQLKPAATARPSNALTELRQKIDHLTLERNNFRCRNQELEQELNALGAKVKQVPKLVVGTQTNVVRLRNEICQTEPIKEKEVVREVFVETESDQIRHNLELKIKELNQEIDLNLKLSKSLDDLKAQMERQSKDHEAKLSSILTEFNINKKVSDTIIKQQKKLLDYLQTKLGEEDEPNNGSGHHNIKTLFKKKPKVNPLLANLHKTSFKPDRKQAESKPEIKEIELELNENYLTYSELARQADRTLEVVSYNSGEKHKEPRQIHVFITGLNTCPTYCHVCQKLIPLIAYASKCQLCSFTCHSTCSSSAKNRATKNKSMTKFDLNSYDPLKYCNVNYLVISLEYNNYINKLINLELKTGIKKILNNSQNASNVLLNDYVYVDTNSKWKKLWLSLRMDEKQQEAKLDLYQTRSNQKPFDTINLIQDKILIETNPKVISKLTSPSSGATDNCGMTPSSTMESIYEEVNDDIELNRINFEKSSLIILLHGSNRVTVKLGFSTYNQKNIWYDALLSSLLVGRASNSSLVLNTKKSTLSDQFNMFTLNKVLKPFLELCDTVVNSYCFINDNLIALACDDGLYALNSYNHPKSSGMPGNNISLVKIDKVESAHKLYYENEFGKLCFIGKKSRQFLSIDVNELNSCLINADYKSNEDFEDEDDDAKSVQVTLEHIHNIDRCHLFECKLNKSNGYWYLAVATPETIYILLFNKITNKYTMVKTIQTQADSPCLCIKFTNNFAINQLIYACGKDFFKMDITYLQPTPFQVDSQNSQPIALCVLTPSNYCQQEAVLLCYEAYGIFMVYNFNTNQWQLPTCSKKNGSSSSIASNGSHSTSNLLQSSATLKWPRGNGLTPLQIEYDSSYLYLFYNDCIIVYQINFEADLSLSCKKSGVTFIYKPRYLNLFNNKSSNCIIISNRRPLDEEEQAKLESDDAELDEDGERINDPLLHDLNDKICLSYFSPGSN
ncbi:serine threonine- kinase MRCK alpha isoform X3 [Brachionus plicatilis]|uniref:Serine threonine-kinase MRCK alpha isoform X3 n=1 Tax=Brachionus plicatilis TaxID=10195 RepID=A0A3M7SZN3_BRAPC|nr:serine threonine- kinase MRCK alpha isoform X3 [Brachionus plicatilis]